MAGCAAVAGSATIGSYCLVGGAAGILGHLEICDRVMITAMSLVTHSIREPGEYSSGTPLMQNREWRKNAARFRQLDTLARRVRSEEHTSELQSLMRISYAVFCLKKKTPHSKITSTRPIAEYEIILQTQLPHHKRQPTTDV